MSTTHKKKLIEVAIPLEAINDASAKEKSIRHGHPSTLHLWWARRPLAACRAVLFAQLVDDPSAHPDRFPTEDAQDTERKRLFDIISQLVQWENSTNEEVLERARAEIRKSCGDELPPVYDPFSGGGSIPLEAQRLGLPAYGSDLNPVAVMIGKAMIEIPPKFRDRPPVHPGIKERSFYRYAEGLAEDIKHYGEWVRQRAWERIGDLYPKIRVPNENGGGAATVVAWLWTRTVPSPDPAFSDVQVPLAANFLVSTRETEPTWLEPVVEKHTKRIFFKCRTGGGEAEINRAKKGTKSSRGANFECIFSGAAITPRYVKENAAAGRMKRSIMAIVAEKNGNRIFLIPDEAQNRTAHSAIPEWRPDLSLPNHPQYIGVAPYGYKTFSDLFLERQILALDTFSSLINEVYKKVFSDIKNNSILSESGSEFAENYAKAICIYLSFAIDKCADYWTTSATWMPRGTVGHLFSRHAIPMTWDFPEANPFADGFHCSFLNAVSWVSKCVAAFNGTARGQVQQTDAQNAAPPDGAVISTDPPYYDNVPYADISDFFYVWMRRSLRAIMPEQFTTISVPKAEELVADRMRHGSAQAAEDFFTEGMKFSLRRLWANSSSKFPTTIYYAFKQSEMLEEGISSTGWATFLEAVVAADYSIHATWPIRTERAARMRAIGSNVT